VITTQSTLVNQVKAAIHHTFDYDARTAIQVMATWLKEQGHDGAASKLEKELEKSSLQ
jgi:hypothetical protein